MFSQKYINQIKRMHKDRPQTFGGRKVKKLGKFPDYMKKWQPKSLIDYGCGKGMILKYLTDTYKDCKCIGYDPGVEAYKKIPKDAVDCVFSNDVLEHIEPNYLEQVLAHIDQLSTKYIWLRIDSNPARKFLPDGRNAHLIQEKEPWWRDKITQHISGKIIFFNQRDGKLDFAIEKE